MKRRLALVVLATIAALALTLVGCGSGSSASSASSQASSSAASSGSGNVAHYYQMEKVLAKSHSDIHDIFDADNLIYAEPSGITRCWGEDNDAITGKFENMTLYLLANKKWGGSRCVPESEIDSDDYKIESMVVTLSTNKPVTSLFNSEQSASELADLIMKQCELSNMTDKEYSEQGDAKHYKCQGTCKMNGEDAYWEIELSDGYGYGTNSNQDAIIAVNREDRLY